MTKTGLTLVAIIVILLIGGVVLYMNKAANDSLIPEINYNVEQPTSTSTDSSTDPNTSTSSVNVGVDVGVNTGTVKSFTVNGSSFAFAPTALTVNKGDTVKITFKNTGGNHDLKIDEFNAGTKILSSGQEETITFVANKAGSFEYYCSVGSHRAMGMKGTLTVK
jgi:plastocyanin